MHIWWHDKFYSGTRFLHILASDNSESLRSVCLSDIHKQNKTCSWTVALAGWMCECGRRLHINSIYECNCLRWHTELSVLHRFTFSATYWLYYAATARAEHSSLSFYFSSSISNNNDNNNFCRFFFPSLLSRMLMRFVDIGTIRCRHRCYCYICFANSHCTHMMHSVGWSRTYFSLAQFHVHNFSFAFLTPGICCSICTPRTVVVVGGARCRYAVFHH